MSNAPVIDALPAAPTRADSIAAFDNKAFNLVDALATFVAQANSLGAWMGGVAGAAPEPLSVVGTSLQLAAANKNRYLLFTNENAKTLICPSSTQLVAGTQWLITNMNTGGITLDTFGGSTINNNATVAQNESALLIKISDTEYNLIKYGGSGGGGGGSVDVPTYLTQAAGLELYNSGDPDLMGSIGLLQISGNYSNAGNTYSMYFQNFALTSDAQGEFPAVTIEGFIPSGRRPPQPYNTPSYSIGSWLDAEGVTVQIQIFINTNGDVTITCAVPNEAGIESTVFPNFSIPFSYPTPIL